MFPMYVRGYKRGVRRDYAQARPDVEYMGGYLSPAYRQALARMGARSPGLQATTEVVGTKGGVKSRKIGDEFYHGYIDPKVRAYTGMYYPAERELLNRMLYTLSSDNRSQLIARQGAQLSQQASEIVRRVGAMGGIPESELRGLAQASAARAQELLADYTAYINSPEYQLARQMQAIGLIRDYAKPTPQDLEVLSLIRTLTQKKRKRGVLGGLVGTLLGSIVGGAGNWLAGQVFGAGSSGAAQGG